MSVAGLVKNLQAHLKDPLYLNSYLLIGMQMLGTIFGFIFWALAARRMPAEAVGLASGALSAAMLLSGLAQIGLGYGLVRNLPKSHNPFGLVTFTLAITTFAGIILSILFLVVVESWSPALATLRQDPLHAVLFVILITGWTLSVTTNWIFIAARRVIFSFTRQTSHMVVAVLLLLLFTSMMEDFTAALLAHTIAVVFSVIISLAAFPKAMPGFKYNFAFREAMAGLSRKRHAIFSMTNYAGEQVQRAPNALLPLLVINLLGPGPGAYFFVVWTIGSALAGWISSLGQSLFAEGSNDPDQAGSFAKRAMWLGLALIGGLTIIVLFGGRLILMIYGQEYVDNGLHLLYLITLASIPVVLTSIFVNFLRIHDRVRAVLVIQIAASVLGLLFIYWAVTRYGLLGVGVGWLLAQSLVFGLSILWWGWQKRLTSRQRISMSDKERSP
jgi:O-antigen/teichoic acid export membrane protein